MSRNIVFAQIDSFKYEDTAVKYIFTDIVEHQRWTEQM
jgi:hypothetical protein